MTWELSDGTVVRLGGDVEGSTALAVRLRMAASAAKRGAPDLVSYGPQPGAWAPLDLANESLVNIWVRTAAAKAGVAVLKAPELAPDGESSTARPVNPDGRLRIY
jgi:hypothetical protein